MAGRSASEATTIDGAVTRALNDAGVSGGSAIRAVLVRDAEVYDLTEVGVPNNDGKSVSLQDRIAEMRSDEQWKSHFPEKKPAARPASQPQQVAVKPGATLRLDRDSFDALASGKLRVV